MINDVPDQAGQNPPIPAGPETPAADQLGATLSQLVTTGRGIRTLLYFAAAVALLAGARNGAPTVSLYLLFVLYFVVATLWVRGQYEDVLRGTPWKWSLIASWLLVAGGLAALVWYVVGSDAISSRGGKGLYGALALYFGVGALITRWRVDETNRKRVGLILSASALGATVLGAALLGHSPGWLSLLLLGTAILLLAPIALAMLAEEYIIRWSTPETAGGFLSWRWVSLVAGTLIVVAMALTGAALAHTALAGWAIVGLAVVVMTIASSTQADIVAVLALVALMGVTAREAGLPSAMTPVGKHHVLVALGDSYMSGEGASIYFRDTDEGGGDTCRRAPTAWAAQAGLTDPFDGLVFLACSGAVTKNVLLSDVPGVEDKKNQTGEPDTQLVQYQDLQKSEKFTPSLVVLSIGGNDAGFSSIGTMCIAPGNCDDKSDLWEKSLDTLQKLLKATYDQVAAVFPHTPIVVVPYPDPIDNEAVAKHCGQIALSPGERAFIHRFLGELDGRISTEAAAHGFYYLDDMQHALADAHLQLCDPLNDGRPGLNFIGLRSVNGLSEQRFNPGNWTHSSLHPNERGHAAMARVFEHWLGANGSSLAARAPVVAATEPKSDSAVCSLLDTDSSKGCRPQASKWAAQQVGKLILRDGWLLLLVAVAAWFAAVGLFAAHRRSSLPASADHDTA